MIQLVLCVLLLASMHAQQCVEVKATGDLSVWRRLVAKRWIYLSGADLQKLPEVASLLEPKSAQQLCERYGFTDPHEVTDTGMSLVHYAAYENSRTSISLLAEAKVDLNVGDKSPEGVNVPGGCAPLLCATLAGCAKAVEALLDHKANVNQANEAGGTPLHASCHWHTSAPLVRLLLQGGADPTMRCDRTDWAANLGLDAYTWMNKDALQLAAYGGAVDVVRVLLEFGVDLDTFAGKGNHEGMTALQIAEAEGHSEVASLLRGQQMLVH